MRSKIFKSILSVAIAVLLSSLVIIIGVLYPYFGGVQESQLKDELNLAADATEQLGKSYLEGLDYNRYRLTWVDADGTVIFDSHGFSKPLHFLAESSANVCNLGSQQRGAPLEIRQKYWQSANGSPESVSKTASQKKKSARFC